MAATAESSQPSAQPTTYTDLAGTLFRDVIAPDYTGEVRDVITWRHRWRKISNWVEGVAHVLLGVASVLAFSAGFFDNKYLTYASACISTLCLAMLRFSAYANNESVERNAILTRLLNVVGIAPMPNPGAPLPVVSSEMLGNESDAPETDVAPAMHTSVAATDHASADVGYHSRDWRDPRAADRWKQISPDMPEITVEATAPTDGETRVRKMSLT